MSCPLGETGVGKMGEIPPRPSQELRRKGAAARPRIVSGNRPRCFTAQSLSEDTGPEEATGTLPPRRRGRGERGVNWPFVICVGILFLGLAAIPFPSAARITLLVIGGIIFLYAVAGWVLVEDVKMYPGESIEPGAEVHH